MPPISSTPPPVQTPTTDSSSSSSGAQTTSRLLMRASYATQLAPPSADATKSWYVAMAKAWGQALNNQAQVITQLSDQLNVGGNDSPAQITQLTAESMRFSFLATSASTATNSVGTALDTIARKQ
jgi:hypothetical protein